MSMNLGDGFNRRKKLSSDLVAWTNRLKSSGVTRRTYRTKGIEGGQAFTPEPGSEKTTMRHYTVDECRTKIREILDEDLVLALRISLTNQAARPTSDLDGKVRTCSIPDCSSSGQHHPQLEGAARAPLACR
jgi:hypothetical protein